MRELPNAVREPPEAFGSITNYFRERIYS
ncbi:hypothetical protein SAMN05216323_101845 [Williamwhitmania taraxaci]|uniref:Uncharacterized protein n=1 Tax=Williamwhitmania taraxaci TaxID=1640674 RepID=A0A1G6J616_9BACT|nr:hypothetical protein SAMN05216323_101845 [Williamwhitmania taraxaci]